MIEFLTFGKYTYFVWSSYLITTFVLVALVFSAFSLRKRIINQLILKFKIENEH
ncbi:hypothetical protein MNB_SUP05-5-752 [hydrothermal vent metagenome]|uniref:Heme exporter protein D n=1 Tax=hydrothermal vent metagenome TaxID=652676 RepID=A0A1W1BWL4_9ZZZZ